MASLDTPGTVNESVVFVTTKVGKLSWRNYPMKYLKQWFKQAKAHRYARQ
jgi:hypothetical protein